MIETYRGVVHPWLCDIMGHMTTRHYVAMFDDAGYHLVHLCGLSPDVDGGLGFVDRTHAISYEAELPAGALVMVKSGILAIGRTSFSARHVMINLKDDGIAATMDVTSIAFDLKARKPVPLSAEFREKASGLMVE